MSKPAIVVYKEVLLLADGYRLLPFESNSMTPTALEIQSPWDKSSSNCSAQRDLSQARASNLSVAERPLIIHRLSLWSHLHAARTQLFIQITQ
jgi:hypothetical protein